MKTLGPIIYEINVENIFPELITQLIVNILHCSYQLDF